MAKTPAGKVDKSPEAAAAVERKAPESSRPQEQSPALELQRTAGNRAVSKLVASGGDSLDWTTRAEMEDRFGTNFREVKIHTDETGSDVALAAGARAVTSGRHIAFAKGFFALDTADGKKLIAHELAHVVQQARGSQSTTDAAESDAKLAGSRAAAGQNVTVQASGAGAGQADDLTYNEIQQQIAENERQAEAATSQEEVQRLFAQREQLRAQLEDVPEQIPVPGVAAPVLPNGPFGVAKPPIKKEPIRTDYAADEHAYQGMELAYTADIGGQDVYAKGVYKSKRYWLAPHFRSGTENVVYYMAYNPTQKRNEYVVGPGQINTFMEHEDLAWYNAAAAYPLVGDPPEYEAQSGKIAARYWRGDYSGAFQAWKDSWKAAVKNPGFYMKAVPATAGAFAGPATAVENAAPTVENTVASGASTISQNVSTLETPIETQAAADNVSTLEPEPEPVSDVSSEPVSEPAPQPSTQSSPQTPSQSPNATPIDLNAEPRLVSTEQTFSELSSELQSIPEGAGALQQGVDFTALDGSLPDGELVMSNGEAALESANASPRGGSFQSASAQTARSMNTAIRADVGEASAYKAALENGEIGLQRPGGANVPGADFITAVEGPEGMEIVVTDAKASSVGRFPVPKGPGVKPTWMTEVEDAVARMDLGDPILEGRIEQALADGRVSVRQVNIDYSPTGGGRITGL